MLKKIRTFLGYVGLLLLALVILLSGLGLYTVRRSFPQTNGTLKAAGLQKPVEVFRDGNGIPQIYADTPHDLFFAEGYVHAQDRFYQMDFWRHETSGTLAELYGASAVSNDKFLRTVGWERIAEQEYSLADPETKAVLDAYAEGVNAYIGSRSAADLSLEYSILALNGLNYKPAPWSPVAALAWAKAMAWDLRGNLDEELDRSLLNQKIGVEMTNEFLPTTFPPDHPVIVPNPAVGGAALAGLRAQLRTLPAVFGEHSRDLGSNNWVISGKRTSTGMPLLANDPHLSIQMPAIWYEIGLHCVNIGPDCPFDVTGFSFAGAPGVIIGHNNRIAWGFTNVGPDVQDLYIERVNPQNPNQYEVNGQWVDMVVINETIKVKGGTEEPVTIRYTRHGPLITDVYGLKDFAKDSGLDPNYQYAFALRWTALETGATWRSILNLDRARNFTEFRDALRDFVAPSQNIIYADVDGNIGYQTPGHIPIRANNRDGLLPAAGWTNDNEWTRYIPFDELPYAYNPPQGFIATANNAVVGPGYPYMISMDWDPGYRARRIVDMINSEPLISMDYIQKMQGDDLNLGAQEILPYLFALKFDDAKLAKAEEALSNWDDQMTLDSRPAAIYMGFLNALVGGTFNDNLPEDYWPSGGANTWLVLRKLLAEPNSPWWDDTKTTNAVETRDDIIKRALAEGYAALEKRLGPDSAGWTWGALHTSTFRNATVGSTASPAPIQMLFNRGPFATAGGAGVVNAASWNLARDDFTPPGDPYNVSSISSMRMIVDLSQLTNSLTIFSTGQSGHAYHPHYIDMADRWRAIQYHPMLWDRGDVEKNAEGHLTLVP